MADNTRTPIDYVKDFIFDLDKSSIENIANSYQLYYTGDNELSYYGCPRVYIERIIAISCDTRERIVGETIKFRQLIDFRLSPLFQDEVWSIEKSALRVMIDSFRDSECEIELSQKAENQAKLAELPIKIERWKLIGVYWNSLVEERLSNHKLRDFIEEEIIIVDQSNDDYNLYLMS